jgi:peptidoglycan/LPS O-acetylase OafA/YrhL
MLGLSYVVTPVGVIRYFGFLQLYARWPVVNAGISPAWTLCVEVTFYALLPLLAIAMRRTTRRGGSFLRTELTLCGLMVAGSLLWQTAIFALVPATSAWRLSLLLMLPGSLDLFAAGMALAVMSAELTVSGATPRFSGLLGGAPWAWWLAALGSFWVVGAVAGLGSEGLAAWWIPTHLLKATGSALLLVPLVFDDGTRGRFAQVLGSRPMLYLGAVSYGVYLWHFPLLDAMSPGLERHGELVTGLVLTVVTVAVASLSLFVVERPAQRLARRYLDGRTSRVAILAPR